MRVISSLIVFFFLSGCFLAPRKEEPREVRKDVRLLFGGDVMLDWGIREVINNEGYEYPFMNKFLVAIIAYIFTQHH